MDGTSVDILVGGSIGVRRKDAASGSGIVVGRVLLRGTFRLLLKSVEGARRRRERERKEKKKGMNKKKERWKAHAIIHKETCIHTILNTR